MELIKSLANSSEIHHQKMKIKTKKIIAKEFLFLLAVVIIGFLSAIGTIGYNAIINTRIKKYNEQISEISQRERLLSHSYDSKLEQQNWFFTKYKNYFNITSDTLYDTREKLWKAIDRTAQHDSIIFKWENVWAKRNTMFLIEAGFNTPQQLQTFFDKNRISETEVANKIAALDLVQKITILNNEWTDLSRQRLSRSKQIELISITLACSVFILFVLRHLIYAAVWSINILRTNKDKNSENK